MSQKTGLLLIGRGHLGTFLKARLGIPNEAHWTGDLEELTAVHLRRLAPSAIVNTAGKTDLSWCEEHPLEAFRCNVTAPLRLLRAWREACAPGIPLIHFSSGCVWDGPYKPDGSPFDPFDPPTPACFYAWTKAAGDAMLLQEAEKSPLVILRPRQVYSPLDSPRNTLTKLRRYPALIETPNSMTSAETIARTLEGLLSAPGGGAWGRILNVYDLGITSPFEVGELLAYAGLRAPPVRLAKADLDQTLKPKRVDVVLQDAFFEDLVTPPRLQEELRRVISAYARTTSNNLENLR